MQAHPHAADQVDGLGDIEHQVGQRIRGVISSAVDAAQGDLLHVVVAVELQPQAGQKLNGTVFVDAAGFEVTLEIGEKDLVDAPQGVGVDAVLPGVDDMGEPQALDGFVEGARRELRNLAGAGDDGFQVGNTLGS